MIQLHKTAIFMEYLLIYSLLFKTLSEENKWESWCVMDSRQSLKFFSKIQSVLWRKLKLVYCFHYSIIMTLGLQSVFWMHTFLYTTNYIASCAMIIKECFNRFLNSPKCIILRPPLAEKLKHDTEINKLCLNSNGKIADYENYAIFLHLY